MKTLVCDKPFEFSMIERPRPAPAAGEVLVRIRRIGICGTDLHAYQGKQAFFSYPRVLGHELAGEVAELGSGVDSLALGEHVLVIPYLHCGHCIACRRGASNCCCNMQVMGVHKDGGMSEFLIVPANHLVASKTLPLEQMALVECLAIGAHAVRRGAVQPGENALVIGAGPIGLGCVQMLKAAGAGPLVVDLDQGRLDFCSRELGVDTCLLGGSDLAARLEAACGGDLPTLVIDATGHAGSMSSSFQYCAHSGRIVFVGLSKDELRFVHPDIHKRELSLHCSRNATRADFQAVINGLEAGSVKATCMISHRCGFAQLQAQFPSWLDPKNGVIKAMVEID